MNNINADDSSCIAFLHQLETVKTSTCLQKGQSGQILYTTRYNGFIKPESFVKQLKKSLRLFCDELLTLPLKFPDCLSRKTFFLNLYKKICEVEAKLDAIYEKIIAKRFPVESRIEYQINKFRESNSNPFNDKLFRSRKDYQNQKLHCMFEMHYTCVLKAKQIMKNFAKTENINIESEYIECVSEPKVNSNGNVSELGAIKFKTDLSVTQLSHAFNLFFECVCKSSHNKKLLAEIIAANFETSRSKQPSKNQVYKKFFDTDKSTNDAVKDLIIEMLNKVKRN